LASINGKENIEPGCPNFQDDIANTMTDKIAEQKIRSRALEQAHEERAAGRHRTEAIDI
jgi:hypothetical protein